MIRPTYLKTDNPGTSLQVTSERARPKRQVVPEYFLLVLMIGLACLVNYLNWRADDQDQARIFAAHNTNAKAPRPPYIISTPMRRETVFIGKVKVHRQWFFNDDATMRYVDIVPIEGAAKVGYVRDDVVFSHDRTRKLWQKTEVAKGDSGRQAAYISYNFNYKDNDNYTVMVVSATQGGWEWTHHLDTYQNNQLAKQLIYSRSGAATQRLYAVTDKPSVIDQPPVAGSEAAKATVESDEASAGKNDRPRPVAKEQGANPQNPTGANRNEPRQANR